MHEIHLCKNCVYVFFLDIFVECSEYSSLYSGLSSKYGLTCLSICYVGVWNWQKTQMKCFDNDVPLIHKGHGLKKKVHKSWRFHVWLQTCEASLPVSLRVKCIVVGLNIGRAFKVWMSLFCLCLQRQGPAGNDQKKSQRCLKVLKLFEVLRLRVVNGVHQA